MNQYPKTGKDTFQATERDPVIREHIVEIVSDSGEGAQKCGQSFAAISAKMGNGVWTVEIIPAEIQPPARTIESASGIRIRLGSRKITNMGDEVDLVVALNEQVPYARILQKAFRKGTIMLLESKWSSDESEYIRTQYAKALDDFEKIGLKIIQIPMEVECLKVVKSAKKGKNMWVLGLLCYVYDRNLEIARNQVRFTFRTKSEDVIESNILLLDAGYQWAADNLDFRFPISPIETREDMVVMNGNEAIGFGVLGAGIEVCSMYPITPATSASHMLAECFHESGGLIHQAEDEIAAIGFAIGSSYAGKTPITITSGPGIALKTEFIGLAAMAELPLVIVDVQRGGPSTGLPTKVEQGDLLAVLYGQPGDTPKIVLAASTIEECFHFVILARKIAESFRTPVFLLTDANLATGQQPFPRPNAVKDWFSPPVDQSPWKKDVPPYDWNEKTGLSRRPIPGQPFGMYTLTGLAHNEIGQVSYDPENNQKTSAYRSKKLVTFRNTLNPPQVFGDPEGDLLIVGWGSTRGAIEEAIEDLRDEGMSVSSLHLRFLSPLEPGLKEIFIKFRKVMTIEINYSDDPDDPAIGKENRRYAQLAWVLRAETLIDVDCFSNVEGQPLRPGNLKMRIRRELKELEQKVK